MPMGSCLCVLMLLGDQDPRETLSAASGPFWTIAQPEVKVCSMLGRVSLGKLARIFKCDLCEHEYVNVFCVFLSAWILVPVPFCSKMSFSGLAPPLGLHFMELLDNAEVRVYCRYSTSNSTSTGQMSQ